MEPQTQRFTIAYLTQGAVPAEEFQMWPQHMTIITWFTGTKEAILEVLVRTLEEAEAFEIKIGEQSSLSDEPVYLLDKQSAATVLHFHNLILERLAAEGLAPERSDHMGLGYIPHISIKRPHPRLRMGEILTVDKVHLIAETDRSQHMRQVVGEVSLDANPAA
jgi:hypothetical protein